VHTGEFAKVITNSIPRRWILSSSIFVHDSKLNVDLSDHGNPTPGTPVTIWGKWEGENQVWRFEQV